MKQLFSILLLAAIAIGCSKNSHSGSSSTSAPMNPVIHAAPPVASFKITNTIAVSGVNGDAVKEGTPLAISNSSQNGATYYWDFGNGNTSTEKVPSNEFLYPCMQNNTVTLTVTNADGVSTTSSQSIYVACYRSVGGSISPGEMPVNWPQH